MSYLIAGIVTFITGTLIAWLSFKYFRKRINYFTGRLYTIEANIEFSSFLYKNLSKIFHIDISLTDEEMESFNKDFYFTIITNPKGILFSGALMLKFNRKDEESMHVDPRPSSRRIVGYFKITHHSGPQQGIFTMVLAHVPLESIYSYT